MSRPTIQHLELDPRASDFLEMLRDLGHLDDAAVEKLTTQLVASPRPGRLVTFEELRRAVAMLLFDAETTMRPDARELLAQEWPRLFS
ncbi:MAG: hypothetical protein ACK4YP_28305 [Myxococcota bacterium]